MFKYRERMENGNPVYEWLGYLSWLGGQKFQFRPNEKTITITSFNPKTKKHYKNAVFKYSDFTGRVETEETYKSTKGSFSDNVDLFFSGLDEKTSYAQYVMQANMMPVYTTLDEIHVTFYFKNEPVTINCSIVRDVTHAKEIKEDKEKLKEFINFFYKETGAKRIRQKIDSAPQTEMDTVKVLREYKKLLDDGIITEEQFNAKRDELMS